MAPKNAHMKIWVGAEEPAEEMKKEGHRGREKPEEEGVGPKETVL